jgi:serine/threonine protein kinase HipA of HipAB toxin-antitoxin module
VVPLPVLPQEHDVGAEAGDEERLPPPGSLRAVPRTRQGIDQEPHGDAARPADRELRGRVAVEAVPIVPQGIEPRLSKRHQHSASRRDAGGDPPVERFERVGEAARDVENLLVLE